MPDCQHQHSVWTEEGLFCPECDAVVAVPCDRCGGSGFLDDETEDSFDLFANDLICDDCAGQGYVYNTEAQG